MGAKKGRVPWNKGLTKETSERVRKISNKLKNKPKSKEHIDKIKKGLTGKKYPNHHMKNSEIAKKVSDKLKGIKKNYDVWNKGLKGWQCGDKNPNWKGGNPKYIRTFTPEYIKWRTTIFERDNYKCQMCNQIGNKLNSHHIFRVIDFPEFEFELWNGITLCLKCHQKTYFNEYKYALKFLAYTGDF